MPEQLDVPALDHLTDRYRVELPSFEDLDELRLMSGFHDEEHPLLRLGEHYLIRIHPLFALWHPVKVHANAVVTSVCHLKG